MESSAQNMQRARFEIIGLALLALGLGSGCSSDGSGTEKGDGGSDGGNNGSANQGSNENGGDDAGENNGSNANGGNNDPVDSGMKDSGTKDSGPPDSGMCTPMYNGCDDKYPGVDPTTLCGQIDNGCGVMIDCNPNDTNCAPPNDACNDPAKPNQCGCLPKTCADAANGGAAACGLLLDDGCGGTIPSCGAGDCKGVGANYSCADDNSVCECSPSSFTEVCSSLGRSCGDYPNGCGGSVDCSEGAGCSANKTCVPSGQGSACACDTRETQRAAACLAAGATCGSITTADGCTYTCGSACTTPCASQGACASCTCPGVEVCYESSCCIPKTAVEACGAQDCGTADDGCGSQVNCGTNAGGCGAGEACADPAYNLDAPTRGAARVQKCLASDQANLLGKYLVRTHAFRNADTAIGEVLSRAEALSIVTIERSGGALRLIDEGCVATSVDENGGNPSLASRYFNIPQVVVPLGVPVAGSWMRTFQPTPTGYINSRPGYCAEDGTLTNPSAPDFDTTTAAFSGDNLVDDVTSDSGPHKAWIGGNCTCKTGDQTGLPTQSTSSTIANVTDCRVNDIDGDGQPGFTLLARATGANMNIRVATRSSVQWSGTIDPGGLHTGFATEPDGVSRAFLGCSGTGFLIGVGCNAIANVTDWSCGSSYNRIQFRKLAGADLTLSCLSFYDTPTPSTVDHANEAVINARFSATPGSSCTTNADCGCTTQNNCSSGAICKSSECWPLTTPQACAGGGTCPSGWRCDPTDNSCWPATCAKP